MSNSRPNVLIFCVDEMRADHMACAGNRTVRTPNLDRLAAMGTLFSSAHCNNPICMPARATMFTGLLPRDHGVRVNGQALRRDLPTLPGVLADAGWRTHSAGKLHLTPWVPLVDPPQPELYPECISYWNDGHIKEFPTPYFGFQEVDFVGGHVSYAYGPYIRWLEQQGGDRKQLAADASPRGVTGGKLHVYDVALPEELHYNRYIADATIRRIEQSARDGEPFFAWCSFPDPHEPYAAPRPYCDMYDPADVDPPATADGELDKLPPFYRRVLDGELRPNTVDASGVSEDDFRAAIAMTYGMITHVDTEIGRVMDALTRCGLADNTVVIFTGDHGDMMGDHGIRAKSFYTFHGCIRVPMIAAAPGLPGGRICDSLISQIDLMPSVLDLCGVDMPGARWRELDVPGPFIREQVQTMDSYPGRSWRGLLDGSAESIRDAVVIENDDPSLGFRVRTLVTPQWRLTVYPGTADGELFDRTNDPDELNNLWHDPAHAALRAELIAQLLDEYSRRTPWYPIPRWNS